MLNCNRRPLVQKMRSILALWDQRVINFHLMIFEMIVIIFIILVWTNPETIGHITSFYYNSNVFSCPNDLSY